MCVWQFLKRFLRTSQGCFAWLYNRCDKMHLVNFKWLQIQLSLDRSVILLLLLLLLLLLFLVLLVLLLQLQNVYSFAWVVRNANLYSVHFKKSRPQWSSQPDFTGQRSDKMVCGIESEEESSSCQRLHWAPFWNEWLTSDTLPGCIWTVGE